MLKILNQQEKSNHKNSIREDKRNQDLSQLASGNGFNVKVKVIPKNCYTSGGSHTGRNRISQT